MATFTGSDITELLAAVRRDVDRRLDEAQTTLRIAARDGYVGDLYRTTYEVEGSGEFPYDMLRYDGSYPADEASSYAMAADRENKRTVRLAKYHRDPEATLGMHRWGSKFRWRVVRVVERVAL